MSARPTISTLPAGGRYSVSTLNSNLQALRDHFDTVMGRAGTGGANNTMTGDLDMNGNDIRNVDNIVFSDADSFVKDSDFGSDGLLTRVTAGTYQTREVIGGTGIDVTNGTGVSGDLTLAIDSTVLTTSSGISVAQGGTGATSFTDGGVLLGSGTGAITPMGVLANSAMIVGDGTTDPVAESGATLRTSVGVGTGDSPTFTNLILSGNLTVNGSTTTVNSNTVNIGDNTIVLNSDETGTPSQNSGFEIERGTSSNVSFLWDESNDRWTVAGQALYGTGTLTFSGGGALTGTWSDLGTVSTINIDGGTVDGAVIGGASAAAITGTTLTANTSITLATGGAMTGVLDSDAMSGTSAALLSTSESIKAYVDSSSKAAGISMTWETTTTDTDQGVGKVWASASSFTPGSDYTLYFDDVERNSVSINALIDSLDDPTATNSATIYIQEAGTATAGLVFLVNGSVTSASTYSKIAVEHVATFGTLSDGDVVGVTIAFSGNNGAGSGDLVASNNLSDVSNSATSLNNLGGVGLGIVLALG
jgi:hypothetical protein